MKVFSITHQGRVSSIEMGSAPFGKPMMTARMYMVDNILIDTGLKHCQQEVLSWLKENRISSVYLTHHHEDHSGNAAAINHNFEIPIYGHGITVEKMAKPFPIFPYQHYMWGASTPIELQELSGVIETGRYKFQPFYTPGHSRDHIVYWEQNEGWLFSGDLYLSDRIKYFRSDEVLKDQISSLEKVLTLDFESLFCAHNPQLKNGKTHLAKKLDNFKSLVEQVELHWKKGMTRKQIMKTIGIKEELFIRLICTGNIKAEFIVASAIKLLEEKSVLKAD